VGFTGWPMEALEFYEGLEADNSKTYWSANKAVYEEKVRAPMEALVAELASELGEGRIYRPYRDVRFSADKTPYKTTISASFAKRGYVQLGVNGLGAGAGMWMMAADQLEKYRKAVDAEKTGPELVAIKTRIEGQGIEVGAHGELKTAPRGYPKDHPRVDLLRAKGLTAWKSWSVEAWLGTKTAKTHLLRFFEAAQPLDDWLARNVGSSELPPHER
jgi:uncharacterized protein (TIGR02453 family)